MNRLVSFACLLLLLVATGCATTPRPPPLTQPEVVAMVQAGKTDEEIMRLIDQTYSVFRLSPQDVVALRDQGVSDRLIAYMMETHTRAAVAAERQRSWYYGGPYYYYYPFPYHSRWHHYGPCR
jgi:hypothetical protein